MLSEEAIEKLIQPIIDRQENINAKAIEDIAKHIKEIGEVNPSDVQKLITLRNAGADAKKLVQAIAKATKLQEASIREIIKVVAKDAYLDAKPFYEASETQYIPWDENIELQRRVNAMAKITADEYMNLSKAQAFMLRDPSYPQRLVPTPIAKAYQSVVDEAVQAASNGTIDYNSSMRKTLRQLVDSGIRRVEYSPESGRRYTQRLDTALRRNLLDGVRMINQEVQNIVGEEFNADGVEISVHMNPAPDHAEMQGHQFTREEFNKMQNAEDFQDIQGRKYSGFDRAVGTLNCRHFAYSIIIGVQSQNFSDKQLKEILEKNEKGYTLPNGKHLTMYECTQYQRQLETKIRYAKDGQIAALAAGDDKLAKEYQAKINKLTNDYKAFSNACGLKPKFNKTTVNGYHVISTK